jgi:hypothetical protein
MALPGGLSRSQIQKLGERLAPEGRLSDKDQELLEIMLGHYQEAMVETFRVVDGVVDAFNTHTVFNVTVTPRLKNTSV